MKKLQRVNYSDLIHPGYLWIINNYGYVSHEPLKQAQDKIDKGWHKMATPSEVVQWYLQHTALPWKGNLFVPGYEMFAKNQGYTNHWNSLVKGLATLGVTPVSDISSNTDAIFIFNSVWVACENNYLKGMRANADKNNIPLFMLTMFETDTWPQRFVDQLQYLDFLIVNNQFNKETLEKQGLKCPIYVLPNCNPEGFKLLPRPDKKDEFVFYHYNAFDRRKGFPEYLEAFINEFKPDEKVKLVLKSRENDPNNSNATTIDKSNWNVGNRKIEWIKKDMNLDELLTLHQMGDCFVFPSKGEGWGFPPIEAILTGNPVIATDKMGMAEWYNSACFKVRSKKEPASFHYLGEPQKDVGNWFKPNIKDIQRQMRKVYTDYQEKGRQAPIFKEAEKQSKIIADKYSNDKIAREFIDILEKEGIIALYD